MTRNTPVTSAFDRSAVGWKDGPVSRMVHAPFGAERSFGFAAGKRARIERRVWDSGSGRFAPTGEAVEGEVSALEQLANNLSGSPVLFLKGPVPWPWIIAAAAFGVDRAAKSRALAALEGAGLIQVAHQPGRFPTVTLPMSAGSSGRGARRKNNQ